MRSVRTIGDLDSSEIRRILERSRHIEAHGVERSAPGVVGLMFLTSSVRTRVGFGVASHHLGLTCVDVNEIRSGAFMSSAESLTDTLRTVSGMVDVVVMRSDVAVMELNLEASCTVPFINAGDGGQSCSHPTQGLIDLRAVEDESGPIEEQVIALSGDLNSRTARSFVEILGLFPPRKLIVMGAPGRAENMARLTPQLAEVAEVRNPSDVEDVDVLYLPGLASRSPSGDLGPEVRDLYAFTPERAARLGRGSVVLSPMPVIDEIHAECRADPRVRLFGPSDRSVSVRAAVLEWVLER